MNIYSPPKTDFSQRESRQLSVSARILLLPAFSLGGLATSAAAFFSLRLVPLPRESIDIFVASLLAVAALAALCGAAPWWWPLARVYRRHALFAGICVGAVPALLRVVSLNHVPVGWFSWSATLIDTVGLVVAFAVGAAIAALRLGANNSSKPAPLRGAA